MILASENSMGARVGSLIYFKVALPDGRTPHAIEVKTYGFEEVDGAEARSESSDEEKEGWQGWESINTPWKEEWLHQRRETSKQYRWKSWRQTHWDEIAFCRDEIIFVVLQVGKLPLIAE